MVLSIITFNDNRRLKRITVNYDFLNKAEEKLGENESFLQFHDVDKDLLNDCKITSKELAYIIANLNASALYYRLKGGKIKKFTESRIIFLQNDKVKNTWQKIIKNRFISNSNFTKAVDKFYEEKK